MFVFASLLTIATWFIARFFYDLVLPSHRVDPRRARRRFATITVIGALFAGIGSGCVVAAAFTAQPGIITGVVVGLGYLALVSLLRRLLQAWQTNE